MPRKVDILRLKLGLMALKGDGNIDKDELKGLTWLFVAMDRGDLGAAVFIKKSAVQYDSELIAKAIENASAWTSRQ